ncbi:hypothetical protein HanRHA438_Chr10g0453121 [Helianthus annuus]|nr:hypothetical protein HanRHA438_Chr10g0453121 [Helianthus annuus]
MGKYKSITYFFKRKNEEQVKGIDNENNEIKRQKALTSELVNEPINETNQNIQQEHDIPQNPININEVDVSSLERDPAKRLGMWKYPVNIELLSLSATLCSKKINIDQIVLLIGKYYPKYFTEQERNQLHGQLETFKVERINNAKLTGVSTLSDL